MQSERIKSKNELSIMNFYMILRLVQVLMLIYIWEGIFIMIKVQQQKLLVIISDYTIKREVEKMKSFNHQNIVRLLDVFHSTNNINIVTEYCKGGDLKALFRINIMLRESSLNIQINLKWIIRIIKKWNSSQRFKTIKYSIVRWQFKNYRFWICKTSINGLNNVFFCWNTSIYGILNLEEITLYNQIRYQLGLILYEMIYKITQWHSTNVVELLNRLDKEPLEFPFQPQIELLTGQIIIGCLGKEERIDGDGINQ